LSERPASRRGRAVIVGALVTLASVTPFRTEVVPPLSVAVVDSAGNPAARACVTQYWQHDSWFAFRSDVTQSDSLGKVRLPARALRASMLRRLGGPITNRLIDPTHASVGVSTQIVARAPGLAGDLVLDHTMISAEVKLVIAPEDQSMELRARLLEGECDRL
jgi:hypothetical protein